MKARFSPLALWPRMDLPARAVWRSRNARPVLAPVRRDVKNVSISSLLLASQLFQGFIGNLRHTVEQIDAGEQCVDEPSRESLFFSWTATKQSSIACAMRTADLRPTIRAAPFKECAARISSRKRCGASASCSSPRTPWVRMADWVSTSMRKSSSIDRSLKFFRSVLLTRDPYPAHKTAARRQGSPPFYLSREVHP